MAKSCCVTNKYKSSLTCNKHFFSLANLETGCYFCLSELSSRGSFWLKLLASSMWTRRLLTMVGSSHMPGSWWRNLNWLGSAPHTSSLSRFCWEARKEVEIHKCLLRSLLGSNLLLPHWPKQVTWPTPVRWEDIAKYQWETGKYWGRSLNLL